MKPYKSRNTLTNMDNENVIPSSCVTLLKQVSERIVRWDFSPVTGYGMFRKHHSYAHIEIKMYKSVETKFNESQIIWNVPTENIPKDLDYKSGVRKSITFFLNFLSTLKGENNNIVFEINDASYHVIDTSKIYDYEYATIYAIIDCFDKTILNFDKDYVERVKETFRNQTNYR